MPHFYCELLSYKSPLKYNLPMTHPSTHTHSGEALPPTYISTVVMTWTTHKCKMDMSLPYMQRGDGSITLCVSVGGWFSIFVSFFFIWN